MRYSGADREETVSAAEADRRFSRMLRGVREGRSYLVTAHGRPIARLVSAGEGAIEKRRVREAPSRALLDRVAKQSVIDIGGGPATNFTRNQGSAGIRAQMAPTKRLV
jgi:prevent-host-death family protein